MQKFDVEVTIDRFDEDVKHLYTMLRPYVKADEISECHEMEEGIFNSIVKMNDPKSNPVVIRIYWMKLLKSLTEEERTIRNSRQSLVDRALELEVLRKASELGITVHLLATFKNGFIYEFVDGVNNSYELYDLQLARQTAIKMAQFHRMRLADGLANSKPAVDWFLGRDTNAADVKERSALFDKKMAESEFEELRNHLPNYSSLCAEYGRLHDLVMKRNAYGPLCLCHNDLNMNNLLIDRKTKEPIFIDFEWANTNYQMFDIGYHLVSFGGVFCESFNRDHVPSVAFIRHWLRCYYEEANRLDEIQITEDEFEQLIDDEVKKVLVQMLLIRIVLIQRAILFIYRYPAKISVEATIKYAVEIYDDFVRNRDQHLKLLDTLRK